MVSEVQVFLLARTQPRVLVRLMLATVRVEAMWAMSFPGEIIPRCVQDVFCDLCDRYGAQELPPAIRERVGNDRVAAFAFPERLANFLVLRACRGQIFHEAKGSESNYENKFETKS